MDTGVKNPGEGRSVWVVGDLYTIKTAGRDTGGALALVEATVFPGSGPPPHRHSREDEAFYVLDGQVEFHADGRSFTAGPGAWVTLARGSLHRFTNAASTPARMLILVTPAGMDDFFLEIGRPARAGDPQPVVPTPDDVARLLEAAPRYGLEIQAPPH